MAEDTAGAVRRTPRPAAPPDLWWSPSMARFLSRHQSEDDEHLVWIWHGHHESLRHYLGTGLDSNPPLPDDAVQLAPVPAVARGEHAGPIKGGSVIDWVKHMVAEYTDEVGSPPPPEIVAHITVAVLREMGWERRPVVLLRAEDCACPVGGDCSHGPEPVDALDLAVWLHAEAAWRVAGFDAITVKLAQINQRVTAERDEAVALCANLQTTILSRLADLTERAGKQRSTEWLRTCATLPMEEWPPAPAYKGPMVPAAERDALSLLLRAMARKLVGYRRWTLGDDVPAVHQLRRERDALQARLAAIVETLGRAAGMMATDSRDWGRDRGDAWLYGLLVGWGCEEQHDHDELCGGQAALRVVSAQHGWTPDDIARIRRFRAALQGDQPVEAELGGVPCSEGCGMHYSGPLPIPEDHDHRHNAAPSMAPCPGRFAAEPTGEVDRG